MRRNWLVMFLVLAAVCMVAGTAVALSCVAGNSERLELAPLRVEIDGEEVDVDEFGTAELVGSGGNQVWIRLTKDDQITEVYFDRFEEED